MKEPELYAAVDRYQQGVPLTPRELSILRVHLRGQVDPGTRLYAGIDDILGSTDLRRWIESAKNTGLDLP